MPFVHSHLQQVQLHPAIDADELVNPLPIGLALKRGVLHCGALMYQTTEVGEGCHFQLLCSVEEVWQIKILNVVASDDVRVNLLDKAGPALWNERKVIIYKLITGNLTPNQTAALEQC